MRLDVFHLPSDRPPQRLEAHLVTRCGCRCRFCSESARMAAFHRQGFSYDEAVDILRSFAAQGYRHVNITGGEPTLFPRLPELLIIAKELGFTTYLATNGLRTRDEAYRRRLFPALDELCLSLHGATAATHDDMTGLPGSFVGLLATIRGLRMHPGTRLFFNTVATRRNVADLPRIALLARTAGAEGMLVSALAPEGDGLRHYRELAIRLADWPGHAETTAEALAGSTTVLRFFGAPLCRLGAARSRSNDLFFDPRTTVERIRLPDGGVGVAAIHSWKPDRERGYAVACGYCPYRGVCGGVFEEHLACFPEDADTLRGPDLT